MAYYHLGRCDKDHNPYELSLRIPDILPEWVSWLIMEGVLGVYLFIRGYKNA